MKLPAFLQGSSELTVSGPKIIASFDVFGITIHFTETIVLQWFVIAILLLTARFLTHKLTIHGVSKRQAIAEMLVDAIHNLVADTMGKRWMFMAPYIATIFSFSILGSLISLLGLRSVTSDFSVLATWSAITFVMITATKIRFTGVKGWLKGFLDPVPVMLPINILSEVATPVSMALRHFGNIAGGAVITALLYYGLTGLSHLIGLQFPIFTIGIPAVLSLYFDLFSGFMQAFIFCMLTMVFISNAAPDETDH
ncbi:MAG: F0F1 ATP synthase subunit A [Oscillospiraceae bacterium]|nr:F0F1 ATP synthase subunit A [Oscillospiraceae bacterium]